MPSVPLDPIHAARAVQWFGQQSRESAVIQGALKADLSAVEARIAERIDAVLRKASGVSWDYFGWDDIYRETFRAFEEASIALQRNEEPELSQWKDLLPRTRTELYAVVALLLSVLSIVLAQVGCQKDLTEAEAETLVRSALRQALQQVERQQQPSAQSTGASDAPSWP